MVSETFWHSVVTLLLFMLSLWVHLALPIFEGNALKRWRIEHQWFHTRWIYRISMFPLWCLAAILLIRGHRLTAVVIARSWQALSIVFKQWRQVKTSTDSRDVNFQEFHFSIRELLFSGLDKNLMTDLNHRKVSVMQIRHQHLPADMLLMLRAPEICGTWNFQFASVCGFWPRIRIRIHNGREILCVSMHLHLLGMYYT